MTDSMTGPEMFESSQAHLRDIVLLNDYWYAEITKRQESADA